MLTQLNWQGRWKKRCLKLSLILAMMMMSASPSVYALKLHAEIMHFWISKGEVDALNVIKQAYEARGGVWSETRSLDYQQMKRDAFVRIGQGFPPSAMLWLSGEDLQHLSALAITNNLDDIALRENWHDTIYEFALNTATVNEHIIAVPLSIHNENWSWYNVSIYQKLGLEIPKNWDQFLQQAPIIQDAGYIPLAISDQEWNSRLLFTTMMAGIAGHALYQQFYVDQDPSVLEHPKMRRLLTIISKLRQYAPQPRQARSWDEATNLVIEGKAAMQIMGDWAKGEFIHASKELGVDYICQPVPEADNEFIAAIDLLTFPRTHNPSVYAGQQLLLETILDKKVQVAYANKKGSIPIRKDIELTDLDACTQKNLANMSNIGHRLLSPRLTMSEQLRTQVQRIIGNFWQDKSITVEMVIDQLKIAFRQESEEI
ncbi:MAG: hypothetical protein COB23_01235 [Methylophaga sp.]|nr:MAG: hypothetical protein COB23_01235 [Methylophaga sp.]